MSGRPSPGRTRPSYDDNPTGVSVNLCLSTGPDGDTVHGLGDLLVSMSGLDTVIDLGGGNTITLVGINSGLLHSTDFLFS